MLNRLHLTHRKEQESVSLGDVARRAGVSKTPA